MGFKGDKRCTRLWAFISAIWLPFGLPSTSPKPYQAFCMQAEDMYGIMIPDEDADSFESIQVTI